MLQTARDTDYDLVRRTIEFLTGYWRDQPSLDEIAFNVGATPDMVQRSFSRWAGITPKQFMQAITLDRARQLLAESATVLDASYEVGLSGPGRLHDLFVTHEGMPPGLYRAKGEGLSITWGLHPSPFGIAIVLITPHGLAGLAFADESGEEAAFEDMRRRWPRAIYVRDDAAITPTARRVFDRGQWRPDQPLRDHFDRNRFRGAHLGNAVEDSNGKGNDLLRCGDPHRQTHCRACGGLGSWP
jgi:AraC family transcriptional regulator of adaptative response/methylated-DNA-[protein]-cysteine methyltransferase